MSLQQHKCCRRRHIHFWPLLVAALAVVIASAANADAAVSVVTAVDGGANAAAKELKHTRNCKALCAHCGCLGFYCGEECICECNGNKENGDADTECIATMQSNARKLDIPFELLIQGPSANRFVRNARQFEQNVAAVAAADNKAAAVAGRNKRSTVVIYKPAVQNSLASDGQCGMKPPPKKLFDAAPATRHKRSVGAQLEWFSDFANTLVRPAPLGVKPASEPEETEVQPNKRSTDDVDRSWFSDNTNLLLRPAPLFKRPRVGKTVEEDGGDVAGVSGNLPQVDRLLKEALRNIQDNTLSDDLAVQLRDRLKEGASVFKDHVQNNDMVRDMLPEDVRDSFGETLSQLRSRFFRNEANENVPTMTPVTAAPQPEFQQQFMLPWFRPMRFLQRVQQAIN